jgi:hypothetical protein
MSIQNPYLMRLVHAVMPRLERDRRPSVAGISTMCARCGERRGSTPEHLLGAPDDRVGMFVATILDSVWKCPCGLREASIAQPVRLVEAEALIQSPRDRKSPQPFSATSEGSASSACHAEDAEVSEVAEKIWRPSAVGGSGSVLSIAANSPDRAAFP